MCFHIMQRMHKLCACISTSHIQKPNTYCHLTNTNILTHNAQQKLNKRPLEVLKNMHTQREYSNERIWRDSQQGIRILCIHQKRTDIQGQHYDGTTPCAQSIEKLLNESTSNAFQSVFHQIFILEETKKIK